MFLPWGLPVSWTALGWICKLWFFPGSVWNLILEEGRGFTWFWTGALDMIGGCGLGWVVSVDVSD